jgi:hypothetical protein
LAKDQDVARIFMGVCAIGLAAAAWQLCLTCGLEQWPAVLLGIGLLFHPAVVMYAHYLNADLPFAALVGWLSCRWAVRWQGGHVPTLRSIAIDGTLVAAAVVIRGNGITLLAAGLVAAAIPPTSRRWRLVLAFALPALLIPITSAAFVAMQSGPRDTGNYRTELQAAYSVHPHLWQIPLSNMRRMPSVFSSAIWPMIDWTTPVGKFVSRFPAIRLVWDSGTVILIGAGLVKLGRDRLGPAVLLQFALTVGVYAVWHYPFDLRFGLPLVPVVTICFVAGVASIRWYVLRPVIIQVVASALILAGGLVVMASVLRTATRYGGVRGTGPNPDDINAFAAIERLTPRNAVIFCGNPELIYLNANRRSAPLLDDSLIVSRRQTTRASLEHWLQLTTDDPVYFLGDQPSSSPVPNLMAAAVAACPYTVANVSYPDRGNRWLGEAIMVNRLHGN